MSNLYRANRRYSNGEFSVEAGGVYELGPAAAALVERDSAGTLTALTADEVAQITDAMAEVSRGTGVPIRPDWRPGPPRTPASTAGGGGGGGDGSAMHSAESGFVAR